MKKIIFLTVFVTITACNNEVEKLKIENAQLREKPKISKSDSILIYKSVLNDINRKFANKFLDSLKNVDEKKYNAIIDEAQNREIFGRSEFDEY